jgi:putative ABC transport system permease protein
MDTEFNHLAMIKNFFATTWRTLLHNKVTTSLNLSGLAIGIAVCLLIGIWLQRELSYDDFHPNGNGIFRIVNTFRSESETFAQAPSGVALGAHLPKEVAAVRSACRVFQFENKFKAGANQFFERRTLVVDSNFFSFFGFPLIQGSREQVLNATNQVVLTRSAAIKYFGSVDNAANQTILMDGQPMAVTGIAEDAPINSHLQFDMIVPYTYFRNRIKQKWGGDLDNDWVGGWPYVYVQLADPSGWAKAEGQINDVIARFSAKAWQENKMSYRYYLQPVRDIHLRSHLRYDAANNGSLATVRIFSIVGIIVLLLACINYINLTTAGAIRRAKETSVRKVIGATRYQLIRQFFSETTLICASAVVLGVLIVKAALPAFSAWMQQPYELPATVTNLAILTGLIVIVSAIAGIYPAAMLSSFNPALSLKGVFFRSAKGNLLRKSLIVFQFTITIALLVCILVIIRQMDFIRGRSLGFNMNAVIEVNYNGDSNVINKYASIRSELTRDPAILNVSRHESNVVGGLGNGWTTTRNSAGEEVSTSIYRLQVDADYFDTYGMQLAAGRFFSTNIPTDTTQAVLVNEAAVRTFGWKKAADAIGKPFGSGKDIRYVIGVVKDFNFESLHKPVEALLIGYASGSNSDLLSLKVDAGHLDAALDHLKKTWAAFVPGVPLQYSFVDERVAEQYGAEQKMEGIFYGFSGLSLLIACLGLFGLTKFVIERKVKEIGIRKVLGANVSGIVSLLSGDFLRQVLIAALIAFPVAGWLMYTWLQDFAYHVKVDWWIFAAAGVTAATVALVTISFLAIRAAMANPAKSLRSE